jgi:hypothetical protein
MFAGSILAASSASAYQLMEPPGAATSIPETGTPATTVPVTYTPATVAPVPSTSATDVAVATPTTVPCPASTSRHVGSPLPQLGADLQAGLAAYAKNPSGGSVDGWIDSGGRFGGGVPASAVRTLMRRGLAAGLTDGQVRSFLQPGFLRGMNDPRGGAWLFRFIGQQSDPAFLGQLAAYAQALGGRYVSPMSAQADVFEALPLLRAAYMSQARAIPPDLETAGQMLSLANQGYGPAQKTVQAFLAAGNHPSAGAQNAGGVPTLMRAAVYDDFVANYAGPLTPAARSALANRGAYHAWVQRIATWVDGGAVPDETPAPAVFPAPAASSATGVPAAAGC